MSLASRARIVRVIVRKDLLELSRDRVWLLLTPMTLLLGIAVFWLMPAGVDETLTLGVTPASLAASLEQLARSEGAQGLTVLPFDDVDALAAAVLGDDPDGRRIDAGLALPEAFVLRVRTGQAADVQVIVDAALPNELRRALESAARELALMLAGAPLPVTLLPEDQTVIGVDRAGAQVPLRDQLRPLLVVMVLLVESLALASLIATEVASKTVSAIVATPARIADLVVAKGLTGTLLAFGQGLFLLLVLQGLAQQPLVVVLATLVGAVLVSSVALLAGAAGRDFMTTLFLGMLLLVPLTLPAFALLFPGSASGWLQALPSFGVLEAMYGASALGRGFDELGAPLATSAAWAFALLALGAFVLSRRVARA